MEAGVKAITDYGITVVAVVALAVLVWWFIRDLKAQRDHADAMADSAIAAFHRLVDQLKVRPDVEPGVKRDEK